MEKIALNSTKELDKKLEIELNNSLKNKDFCNLIKREKITKKEAMKNNSALLDVIEELNNCKNCPGLEKCQNKVCGHTFDVKRDETLKFVYNPCKYQLSYEKKELEKENSLDELKNARMKDIDINDKKRVPVIKWLKEYFDSYEKVNTLKGLYLHGSFGSGKTFLIAALLNELKIKKNALTEIVYLPELLRNMKEDFSLVEDKLRYYQTVDILLIDDIGAEKVTSWGRDEILGTILQYRMTHKLTTFFTSNLNIEELEIHLSITKDSEDKVKSRRIIERIKQLSTDIELVSESKRNKDKKLI